MLAKVVGIQDEVKAIDNMAERKAMKEELDELLKQLKRERGMLE